MNPKTAITTTLGLLATTLSAAAATAGQVKSGETAKGRRPNLLVIMTDQQRWDALGIAGAFGFLQTPNLDKLAREGAWMRHAYTPCAVSAPARASILTGLLVEHHGLNTNERASVDPASYGLTDKTTSDEILDRAGYYAEYHGKWHTPLRWLDAYQHTDYVTPQKKNPFKYEMGDLLRYHQILAAAYSTRQPGPGELTDGYFEMPYRPDPIDRRVFEGERFEQSVARRPLTQPDNNGELLIDNKYAITPYQAKEAIAAIKRGAAGSKPFAVTCSFMFPHAPMLPTAPYYGMYPAASMPVPASIADPMVDSPYKNANGRNLLPQYGRPELIKYMMSNYFALVTELDKWVGEIIAALDATGQRENTLVVFLSDHGEMLGSHAMREKNIFLEESARVPLIINWKGTIRPIVSDSYVSTLDLFPTIMDYLGVQADQRDGRSLRPEIEGMAKGDGFVITEWLYQGPSQPTHMIVDGGWKLFLSYDPASSVPPVLYNLSDDPLEMHNLIGASNPSRSKYAAKATELRDKMAQWLADRGSQYAAPMRQIKLGIRN